MITFFQDGGIFMWPLLIIALIIIYLTIRKTIDLFFTENQNRSKMKNGINAILFWGGFSIVLGVFSHFVGIYLAMQAIKAAGDISPGIVANGYSMSLISILSGLFIFMISAIIWLVLQWKYKKMISAAN